MMEALIQRARQLLIFLSPMEVLHKLGPEVGFGDAYLAMSAARILQSPDPIPVPK